MRSAELRSGVATTSKVTMGAGFPKPVSSGDRAGGDSRLQIPRRAAHAR
jgi:hypothetical protein